MALLRLKCSAVIKDCEKKCSYFNWRQIVRRKSMGVVKLWNKFVFSSWGTACCSEKGTTEISLCWHVCFIIIIIVIITTTIIIIIFIVILLSYLSSASSSSYQHGIMIMIIFLIQLWQKGKFIQMVHGGQCGWCCKRGQILQTFEKYRCEILGTRRLGAPPGPNF